MTSGELSWFGLVLYVIAYDLYALIDEKQSMSEAFYEAVHHPRKRLIVIIAWTLITVHLFRIIRPEYDPIHQLAERIDKWWKESKSSVI